MANMKFNCNITIRLDNTIEFLEHTATIYVNDTYSMNVTWTGSDNTKFELSMNTEGLVDIKAIENHYHTAITCNMLMNGSKIFYFLDTIFELVSLI